MVHRLPAFQAFLLDNLQQSEKHTHSERDSPAHPQLSSDQTETAEVNIDPHSVNSSSSFSNTNLVAYHGGAEIECNAIAKIEFRNEISPSLDACVDTCTRASLAASLQARAILQNTSQDAGQHPTTPFQNGSESDSALSTSSSVDTANASGSFRTSTVAFQQLLLDRSNANCHPIREHTQENCISHNSPLERTQENFSIDETGCRTNTSTSNAKYACRFLPKVECAEIAGIASRRHACQRSFCSSRFRENSNTDAFISECMGFTTSLSNREISHLLSFQWTSKIEIPTSLIFPNSANPCDASCSIYAPIDATFEDSSIDQTDSKCTQFCGVERQDLFQQLRPYEPRLKRVCNASNRIVFHGFECNSSTAQCRIRNRVFIRISEYQITFDYTRTARPLPVIIGTVEITDMLSSNRKPRIFTVRLLLDFGATHSLISPNLSPIFNKACIDTCTVKTAATTRKTSHAFNVHFQLPEFHAKEFIQHALLVSKQCMGYDIVLGHDLLQEFGISLLIQGSNLYFKWKDRFFPAGFHDRSQPVINDSPAIILGVHNTCTIQNATFDNANVDQIVTTDTLWRNTTRIDRFHTLQLQQEFQHAIADRRFAIFESTQFRGANRNDLWREVYMHECYLDEALGIWNRDFQSVSATPTIFIPSWNRRRNGISDHLSRSAWNSTEQLFETIALSAWNSIEQPLATNALSLSTVQSQWLPMGIRDNASSYLTSVLDDLPFVQAFVDDFLVVSTSTLTDHLTKLHQLITKLQQLGVRINTVQSTFLNTSSSFATVDTGT